MVTFTIFLVKINSMKSFYSICVSSTYPSISIGSVVTKRTFNDEELKLGTPNLIVIPSGIQSLSVSMQLCIIIYSIADILRTVLALYMDDENLPLPTLEEVLICDSTTTAEEV